MSTMEPLVPVPREVEAPPCLCFLKERGLVKAGFCQVGQLRRPEKKAEGESRHRKEGMAARQGVVPMARSNPSPGVAFWELEAEGQKEGQREGQTDTGPVHSTHRAMGGKRTAVSLHRWLGLQGRVPRAHNRILPVPVSFFHIEDQDMRCEHKEVFSLTN